MAASIGERFNSRARSGTTTTYRYYVAGTDDLDEVLNIVDTTAPTRLGSLPRGDISADPQGGGLWHCDVPYSAAQNEASEELGADPGPQPGEDGTVQDGGGNPVGMSGAEPLETGISFSTGGGTIRIQRAIEHIADYAPIGQTAPNFGGLINVTGSGANQTVEGVEVKSPQGSFQFRKQVRRLTVGYFMRVLAMTAKTNHDPWKGFGMQEVLFEGVDGTFAGTGDAANEKWDLTFHFGYSPTVYGLEGLPAGWPGIVKRGWHYIWFRWGTVEDASADPPVAVQRLLSAHVEKVYKTDFFDKLQL